MPEKSPLAPGLSPSAQQRAQQIVDAAAKVMARKGYGGTTMKDIAAEAGIAPGLIHYYFDSKEDLLLAVTNGLCVQMLADSEQAFAVFVLGTFDHGRTPSTRLNPVPDDLVVRRRFRRTHQCPRQAACRERA